MNLKWKQLLQNLLVSAVIGVSAGLASALFLYTLEISVETHRNHHWLLWLLPFVGAATDWIFQKWGENSDGGTNLVIDEIHDPQKILPLRMAPFILLGTLATHLAGGSAGREGTAMQMGASISDQWARLFGKIGIDRRFLLMAGIAGGFGSVLGAPWAGCIFGMEVIEVGRLRWPAWKECLIASFAGYYTISVIGIEPSSYGHFAIPSFDWVLLIKVAIAGVFFGLAARAFTTSIHGIEKILRSLLSAVCLRGAVGGLLVALLLWWEGSGRFESLGIDTIHDSFVHFQSLDVFLLKGFFSSLTIASGFKGGEFTPLVFIGSSLGSALSPWLATPLALMAALGFAATFGAAANTPLACTVFAMEFFGYEIGFYAFVTCTVAFLFSSHKGIYHTQKISRVKPRPGREFFKRFFHERKKS